MSAETRRTALSVALLKGLNILHCTDESLTVYGLVTCLWCGRWISAKSLIAKGEVCVPRYQLQFVRRGCCVRCTGEPVEEREAS